MEATFFLFGSRLSGIQFSLELNLALTWVDASFTLGENHFSFALKPLFSFELNKFCFPWKRPFLLVQITLSLSER